jgi:hypothetical protein
MAGQSDPPSALSLFSTWISYGVMQRHGLGFETVVNGCASAMSQQPPA